MSRSTTQEALDFGIVDKFLESRAPLQAPESKTGDPGTAPPIDFLTAQLGSG
jgi:hypothetical protein